MNKFLISILLLFTAVSVQAQPVAKVKDFTMKSKYFNHEREVLIYTPVGYDEFTATDYDVMYVFDSHERSKFDLVHCLPDFMSLDETKHFIVVGICSPNLPNIGYYRNADYLPMPIHDKNAKSNRGRINNEQGYGHSADLKKFLKDELMPYVTEHFRTSGRNIGIGHSLSASFVLDCMVTDDLFDDYIAISPNCCYDEYRLASDLAQYPWMSHQEPRFVYTSMGQEATTWDPYWKEGWQRVSTFLSDRSHFPQNTLVLVQRFLGYEHNPTFLPSLTEAMNEYLQFSTSILQQHLSQETYPVHIELQGKNMKGDVYVTGNQEALASWNPKGIKMKQVNDSTCTIDLQLHLPAYFKFTRGDWNHSPNIVNAEPGNLIIYKSEPRTHIFRLYDDVPWTGE